MKTDYIPLLTLVFFIVAFALFPCINTQSQYLVNGNISWLLTSAQRMIEGQSLAGHIYETNPPLSIMLYIPHVLIAKLLNTSPVDIVFATTFFFVLVSTSVTALILRYITNIENTIKPVIIAVYLISITIATTLSFSEREHYIIMMMLPFILCQFAINNKQHIPNALLIPVFIIGSIGILIKPHYGIVPTVLMFQRIYQDKTVTSFFKIDFWVLFATTCAYLILLGTIFLEYSTTIFPDVVNLYLTNDQIATTFKTGELYITCFILMPVLEFFRTDLTKEQKKFLFLFYSSSLLCLIPYFAQMKGYYNHLIPAYVFFLCGLSLSIAFRTAQIWKDKTIMHLLVPCIAILSFLNVFSALSKNVITQEEIKSLPITRYIEDNCQKPCTFFAFHSDIELFNPTAIAMGYTHGTRFPSYWFLPQLIISLENNHGQTPYYQSLKDKYLHLVAEDLEYYKPSLLLIRKDVQINKDIHFDYVAFFEKNPQFNKIMKDSYTLIETKEFDRGLYFKGTTLGGVSMMEFDIYKRTSTALNP
ncbi:MAG: hypothetical protein ACRBDL_09620 [Alphaproteobacteria bacterium]